MPEDRSSEYISLVPDAQRKGLNDLSKNGTSSAQGQKSPGTQHFAIVEKQRTSDASIVSVPRKKTKKRKESRKSLIWALTSFLVLLACCLAIGCYFICVHISRPTLCLTGECVQLGGSMLSKMNPDVDPCSDFYEFACGGWAKEPVPHGYSQWHSIFKIGNDLINNILYDFETQIRDPASVREPSLGHATGAYNKALDFYESCLDTALIKREGAEPLKEFHRWIGGWGVADGTTLESYEDWSLDMTLEMLAIKGFTSLFKVFTALDKKNTSRNIITLDQPDLTLPVRSLYLDDTRNGTFNMVTTILQQFVNKTASILAEESDEEQSQRAYDVVELEARLALIMDPDENRSDHSITYSLHTISSLRTHFNKINWIEFLGSVYHQTGIKTKGETPVVVMGLGYFQRLAVLIDEYSATLRGKRILDDYIRWRALSEVTQFVDPDIFSHVSEVVLRVYQTPSTRWFHCVTMTTEYFSAPITNFYLRQLKDSHLIKDEARKLTKKIMHTLKEEIRGLSWMDDETKATALSKVEKTVDLVGYSEDALDGTKIDFMFEELEIRPHTLLWNVVNIQKRRAKKNIEELTEVPDRMEWAGSAGSPITFNAYYNFGKNQMIIPMVLLTAPLFILNGPDYSNYASMGSIIGHELCHGFDGRGKAYGEWGNLRSWWSAEAAAEYSKRAQCLIEQYSSFSYNHPSGITLQGEGERTYSENLADNGGLRIAYLAYKQTSGNTLPLPGLNLTADQTFFLSFAQTWCTRDREDFVTHSQDMDAHAMERFRVRGPLQNMREFSEAYSCPLNSPMNPEKKCSSLW